MGPHYGYLRQNWEFPSSCKRLFEISCKASQPSGPSHSDASNHGKTIAASALTGEWMFVPHWCLSFSNQAILKVCSVVAVTVCVKEICPGLVEETGACNSHTFLGQSNVSEEQSLGKEQRSE